MSRGGMQSYGIEDMLVMALLLDQNNWWNKND